jgi:hypothetical protein
MNAKNPSDNSIERPHRRTFCILGLPRSGTTWLVDLLDQHPLVHCSNEILTSDPFVHGVPMADVAGGQVSHLGFKVLEWQNSWWFSALISRPDVPVILLWRENPIRHLYSITAAGRSGIHHDKPIGRQLHDRIRHGTRALTTREFRYVGFAARTIFRMCLSTLLGHTRYHPERLSIPPDDLDRHMDATRRRIHMLRDALEARGGPWLEVRYE